MRATTSPCLKRPRSFSFKMTGTTARFASAIIMSSIFFSLRHVSTFYTHQFNAEMAHQSESLIAPLQPAKQSSAQPLKTKIEQAENQLYKHPVSERTFPVTFSDNTENGSLNGFMIADNTLYVPYYIDDTYETINDEDKRAIVIISMGEEASNTTMVERFVWSARNIGKYNGWIILITDADEERYANMPAAAITDSNTPVKISNMRVKTRNNDSNVGNNFLVFRTQEKRFSRMTTHKKFKSENTMASKIFKTYILKYAKKDLRLVDIELFYYLDVDIVFGNPIQPLFAKLEQQYEIGSLYKSLEEGTSTSAPTDELQKSKIYFFEGNGKMQIQGGQFVLERERSQPCLDRWRTLMIKQRKERYLKDQMQLTMMLEEQRERANIPSWNRTNSTEQLSEECEIVLMKQDSSLIQFPELTDIVNRTSDQEHPVLVHFRNSANVMKNVDEEALQSYMRELLRFGENQEDEHGILNKMLMKVDEKKKRRRKRRRKSRHKEQGDQRDPQEQGNEQDSKEEGDRQDEEQHDDEGEGAQTDDLRDEEQDSKEEGDRQDEEQNDDEGEGAQTDDLQDDEQESKDQNDTEGGAKTDDRRDNEQDSNEQHHEGDEKNAKAKYDQDDTTKSGSDEQTL